MRATHVRTEGKTRRQVVNMALKAMTDICDYSNGTLRDPSMLASSILGDGRSIIQVIHEDGYLMYNDGWYIVEVDEYCMYVDVTGIAMQEMGLTDRDIIDEFSNN